MIKHAVKSLYNFAPSKDNICIVTCHFNFIGWNAPARNLERFVRQIKKENITLFGAEAYLDKPATKDYENWIQVKATNKNICFQKEALLNLIISKLPPNFTKIIVCDHDIWFENNNWIESAERHLEFYDFIQPFSTCIWKGKDGKEIGRKSSFLKTGNPRTGHPGFCIGFKRSSFERIEFYPFCIVGGGDTIFAASVSGNAKTAKLKFKDFFQSYKIAGSVEWYNKASSANFACGYTDGFIFHEHHGSQSNRRYMTRNQIIKHFDFSNVFINQNGLVEFKDEADKTRKEIYQYLEERNEDS